MNQKLFQVLSLTALIIVGVSGFNSAKAAQSCSTCVVASTCMNKYNANYPTCKKMKDINESAMCVYAASTDLGSCLQKECAEACSAK